MVDTGTLRNPDWKDLNLSLNIIAKCGVTPWVLPDKIPDADFFVGLSYTQSRDGRSILGFANVFNEYGKWEFYTGTRPRSTPGSGRNTWRRGPDGAGPAKAASQPPSGAQSRSFITPCVSRRRTTLPSWRVRSVSPGCLRVLRLGQLP